MGSLSNSGKDTFENLNDNEDKVCKVVTAINHHASFFKHHLKLSDTEYFKNVMFGLTRDKIHAASGSLILLCTATVDIQEPDQSTAGIGL